MNNVQYLKKFWKDAASFSVLWLFTKRNVGFFITLQTKSIRIGFCRVVVTIFNYDYELYCENLYHTSKGNFMKYFDNIPTRLEKYSEAKKRLC